MNDSLFKLLLGLFEKTLAQLKDQSVSDIALAQGNTLPMSVETGIPGTKIICLQVEQINTPKEQSVRIFTPTEQAKFTKASHQFLMRMSSWGLIGSEAMELIINRLIFSNSRIVGLQEAKWTTRQALASGLTEHQLAFLDLVLYQREDKIPLH
jgi:hypothetical protein